MSSFPVYRFGDFGITDIFIESVLEQCDLKRFAGCFACDNIPVEKLSLLENFNIICNLDTQDGPGTHFVAIIVNKDKVFYIDSQGNECKNAHISRFLKYVAKVKKRKIVFNKFKIQHQHSIFCGFYAMLFMLKYDRTNGVEIKFSINQWTNDDICIKHILVFISMYKNTQ